MHSSSTGYCPEAQMIMLINTKTRRLSFFINIYYCDKAKFQYFISNFSKVTDFSKCTLFNQTHSRFSKQANQALERFIPCHSGLRWGLSLSLLISVSHLEKIKVQGICSALIYLPNQLPLGSSHQVSIFLFQLYILTILLTISHLAFPFFCSSHRKPTFGDARNIIFLVNFFSLRTASFSPLMPGNAK